MAATWEWLSSAGPSPGQSISVGLRGAQKDIQGYDYRGIIFLLLLFSYKGHYYFS